MPRFDIAQRKDTDEQETFNNSDAETNGTEKSPGNDVASDHSTCSQTQKERGPEARGSFWLHEDRTKSVKNSRRKRREKRFHMDKEWKHDKFEKSNGSVQTFKVNQLVVKIRKRLESNDSEATINNVESFNDSLENINNGNESVEKTELTETQKAENRHESLRRAVGAPEFTPMSYAASHPFIPPHSHYPGPSNVTMQSTLGRGGQLMYMTETGLMIPIIHPVMYPYPLYSTEGTPSIIPNYPTEPSVYYSSP